MDWRERSFLDGLADKHRALLALRAQAGAQDARAARAAMVALAARFPGALRELDQLPLERIEARLTAIEAALRADAAPERWMLLQASYHGYLRAALRLRGVLRRPGAVHAALAAHYEPALDEPARGWVDARTLAAIDRPPGGRLNPWVIAEVAHLHGVVADEVERALWG